MSTSCLADRQWVAEVQAALERLTTRTEMSLSRFIAEQWAVDHMEALERLKLESEPAFPRFFDLPTELRLEVYGHYFSHSSADGDIRIAPRSHPRTRHGTAILRISRLGYQEALPIFYRCATLTLDLDPAYHENLKDFAYFLDHRLPRGLNFKGDVEQLKNFRHVHVTLSKPGALVQQSASGEEPADNVPNNARWQDIVPVLWTTVGQLFSYHIPQIMIALNIGDIVSNPQPPVLGANTPSQPTFASYVSEFLFREDGWRAYHHRAKQPRPRLTDDELKSRGAGRRYLKTPPEVREISALMHAIFWMGSIVESERSKGRETELRLEKAGERSKGVVVKSDKLPDLVESARKLVGDGTEKGEGRGSCKDVWLVLGPSKA